MLLRETHRETKRHIQRQREHNNYSHGNSCSSQLCNYMVPQAIGQGHTLELHPKLTQWSLTMAY